MPNAVQKSQNAAVTMDPPHTFRRVPLKPHQMTSKITPQRDLFVLAHVGVPHVDGDFWRLTIDGMVRESATFTIDQLRQMPKAEVESFHECAGYPANPKIAMRRVGNVVWGGVDLKALLGRLGVQADARFLWSYGLDRGEYDGLRADPYVKDCPLARVEQGGVLLAYEVNGEPLDAEHGYPLRLVIPGFYGTNSVKWLSRLHIANRRADGPFTTQVYNDPHEGGTRPVWAVAPESVIVAPAPNAPVGVGEIEIWGWAWADGGVASVEISTDGGKSWAVAELESQRGFAWQKFHAVWRPAGTGEAILMSRATGRDGATQPAADWRNCVYAVRVNKTGG